MRLQLRTVLPVLMLAAALAAAAKAKEPVDYVNPYIGNISHLLVPTFPTVQLPNSMLRVYPERGDYTSEYVRGLPVIVTNHRERSAFNLTPSQRSVPASVIEYNYDNEHITPYSYSTDLDDNTMHADYSPAHQAGVYAISFSPGKPVYISLTSRNGRMTVDGAAASGYQDLDGRTRVYVYAECDAAPVNAGILRDGIIDSEQTTAEGRNVCAVWQFKDGTPGVGVRYGISFISEEQAKKNLRREIKDYDVAAQARRGRHEWNRVLGRIAVEGGDDAQREVFYTSYYRTFERPVCMSEDGRYWSAFDGAVHPDNGTPFYTDDWIWDTYRAAHPLRLLIEPAKEEDIIASYLTMAEQMGNMWMPTFPEVTGDSRRMNSNHAVATVADAVAKGLEVDIPKAYEACRRGIEEKTLAPWSGKPAGWIDEFWNEHGYIPALADGEQETDPNVNGFEKRQPVAVTLGTAYDEYCLSLLADALGKTEEAAKYRQKALNYRNLYNPSTAFFHPKDKDGRFIEPFDYSFPGGMGAREYYGENNGWVYRWDVPHNVADLVKLMGGRQQFVANLDRTFAEPLGRSKYDFYSKLPDHTGNVGQFSMANEPSLHVPYLYNYAGAPWKTQKRIRQMLDTWFRADLMGVPGDEDGGGMTSFVVFSSIGLYPVTPGIPVYNIGSPLFTRTSLSLPNGKTFEIVADGCSRDNKYIQRAELNGHPWDKPWISHADLMKGGRLVLVMGPKPNKEWGAAVGSEPPSM